MPSLEVIGPQINEIKGGGGHNVFYDLYHSVTKLHSYNTRSANKGNL